MALKLKIGEIQKLYVQAQEEYILDVPFDIIERGKGADQIVTSRKLGFPLNTPMEEVKEELTKFLENYKAELELNEKNKAMDEANEQADATIESLTGETL
jgi:hypothetical protein